MQRFVFIMCLLLGLSGCRAKTAQVGIPGGKPVPVSATELEGLASYYAEPYHGRRTASGEVFDSYKALTAAHRTLPFNTLVRVKNKANGREVEVRINDRGPFVNGRVIDLSLRAAQEIDMVRAGTAPVILTVLKAAEGNRSNGPLYAVQVGAFENQRTAQDLKQQLEKRYRTVSVQSFSGEKTLYRVRVGGESDIAAAQKLASELKKDDLQPLVVRVN
jgi:rare lipoprotein A